MSETMLAGRLVPVEPTEAMIEAGERAYSRKLHHQNSPTPTEHYDDGGGVMGYAWRAMVEAAPALPTAEADELRAALEPFARAYDECLQMRQDDGLPPPSDADLMNYIEPSGGLVQFNPSVGDFRRAHAALATTPETAKPDTSAAERSDYLSDAQARELFDIEEDEALPEGRVRVCDGEWVRIPGGFYFDTSVGPLHPETASEACDNCAVTALHPAPATASSGGMVAAVGWAYRESKWGDPERWHLCSDKPSERPGRDVQAVYPASTIEALSKQVADLTWEREAKELAARAKAEISEKVLERLEAAEAKVADLTKERDALHEKVHEAAKNWQAKALRCEVAETALAEQSRRADEAAEDERDRLLEHAVENSFTAYTVGFLSSQDAMMPSERAAARAARGDDANG